MSSTEDRSAYGVSGRDIWRDPAAARERLRASSATKVVDGRAPREAHLIRACQLQKQKLDRLRADYERLAKWASDHAEGNPFAEQVCMYAYARLAEWEFPAERWEP